MRLIFFCAAALAVLPVAASERIFNFSDFTLDNSPTNFTSLVAGRGKPGQWRVILDEAPPTLAPLSAKAQAVTSRSVLAQKAREPVAGHLPLLIYDSEEFRDFKFTTRFKLAGGALEQSAGLVFHFQNLSNFYVVQASGTAGNIRCTKVVNGVMMQPMPLNPPPVEISKNAWHEMSVQCEGPRITCALDGNELVKLVDNASASAGGKLGFCTQADAVSYFSDAKVEFTPTELFAAKIVRDALNEYSKLVSLKIYAARPPEKQPVVIGSGNAKDVGAPASQAEQDVIQTGHSYFGKGRETVTVVLPLRDHNGEVMAAVSLEMKKFSGQTEDNALVRAKPVVRKLQEQVQTLDELLQ